MKEFYTTNEAAPILGLKPRSVTRYIEKGDIAAEKRGRDHFISHEELERFKRERRRAGRPTRQSVTIRC